MQVMLPPITLPKSPSPRRDERGAVLVLFVMFSFAFLSMAALVIDIGHVFLARRQMVAATESAALDGLAMGAADPVNTDIGRAEASLTVSRHFGIQDGAEFGAGPNIEFTDGIDLPDTDFRASQLIDAETLGPYQPTALQLNLPNLRSGDLVVGQYFDKIDGERTQHIEHSNYQRDDFLPSTLPLPPSTDTALLVRMRRTGQVLLDGILSSGPHIPFLFGRGGLMSVEEDLDRPTDKGALADRRFRGTAVRATSIASLEPATTIGGFSPVDVQSFADVHMPNGVLPFVQGIGGIALANQVAARGLRIQGTAPFAISADRLRDLTFQVNPIPTIVDDAVNGIILWGGEEFGRLLQSNTIREALNSDQIGDISVWADLPLSVRRADLPFIVRIGREALMVQLSADEERVLEIVERDVWSDFFPGESDSDRASRKTHAIGSRLDIISPVSLGAPVADLKTGFIGPLGNEFIPGVGPLEFVYIPVYTTLPDGAGPLAGERYVIGFTPGIMDFEFDSLSSTFWLRLWMVPSGLVAPSNASANLTEPIRQLKQRLLDRFGTVDTPEFRQVFDLLIDEILTARDGEESEGSGTIERPVLAPVLRRSIR